VHASDRKNARARERAISLARVTRATSSACVRACVSDRREESELSLGCYDWAAPPYSSIVRQGIHPGPIPITLIDP
jgi:hypothetical protein